MARANFEAIKPEIDGHVDQIKKNPMMALALLDFGVQDSLEEHLKDYTPTTMRRSGSDAVKLFVEHTNDRINELELLKSVKMLNQCVELHRGQLVQVHVR